MPSFRQDDINSTDRKHQTVLEFVLIEQFSMMSFISAIEPLRVANRMLNREAYVWRVYSIDGAGVEASNGIVTPSEGRIGTGETPDFTFICAGLELEVPNPSSLNAFLARRYNQGCQIGAISMGSFFLARAGLLKNHRCTIHWEGEPALTEAFPELEVTRAIYEVDGRLLTCSGGMASFDLMLSIIARDHSDTTLRTIANQLQFDHIRTETVMQTAGSVSLPPTMPAVVQKAIALMSIHTEHPLSLSELAKEVGASRRSLERLFVKCTGHTPAKFSKLQRLERARDLLLHGNLPIVDIALTTGFRSGAYFSTCFSEHFGVPPSVYRTHAEKRSSPHPKQATDLSKSSP